MTHSFIYVQCVSRLKLEVFVMNGNMVIDTLANGLMTTFLVCLNCPLTIFGREFGIKLVCLPLSLLDVVMGINWLEFNHMFINYFDKPVQFLDFEENAESSFMTKRKVEMSLSESVQLFMVLASLNEGSEKMITDLHMVCDFLEVFPDDISDLLLER